MFSNPKPLLTLTAIVELGTGLLLLIAQAPTVDLLLGARLTSPESILIGRIGGAATKLTMGKTKETFAYEMVGDAANPPHPERVLSPFFVSRNVGVKLLHVLGADQRMTLSGGVFNDGWLIDKGLTEGGTTATTRMTTRCATRGAPNRT